MAKRHVSTTGCKDGRAQKPLVGRPPIDFSNEEVIKLGEELVKFLKDRLAEKDPVIHLTEWYSIVKDFTYNQWENLCDRKEFAPYYDSALDIMVLSTQKNEKLATAYGSRFLGLYSKGLRKHEKEIAKEKNSNELEETAMNLAMLKSMIDNGEISQK